MEAILLKNQIYTKLEDYATNKGHYTENNTHYYIFFDISTPSVFFRTLMKNDQ